MMYPVIRRLLHKRVVLASASPRRQEILSNAVSGRGRARLGPGSPARACLGCQSPSRTGLGPGLGSVSRLDSGPGEGGGDCN